MILDTAVTRRNVWKKVRDETTREGEIEVAAMQQLANFKTLVNSQTGENVATLKGDCVNVEVFYLF